MKKPEQVYKGIKWNSIKKDMSYGGIKVKSEISPVSLASVILYRGDMKKAKMVGLTAQTGIFLFFMKTVADAFNSFSKPSSNEFALIGGIVQAAILSKVTSFATKKAGRRNMIKKSSGIEVAVGSALQNKAISSDLAPLLKSIKERDGLILDILAAYSKSQNFSSIEPKFKTLTTKIKSASSKKSKIVKAAKDVGMTKKEIDFVESILNAAKSGSATFLPLITKTNAG